MQEHVNGRFKGVCVDVVHSRDNLGFGMKDYATLVFAMAVPGRTGILASRKLPMALHQGSAMRRLLEQWRGAPFTDEQVSDFDIDNCIGVGAQARVTSSRSHGGRVYVHAQELYPLSKADTPPIPKDYIRQHHRQSVA